MSATTSLIDFIVCNNICEVSSDYRIELNGNIIQFDIKRGTFYVPNLAGNDHSRIFDLEKKENHCVVMLLIDLFKKGYAANNIYLEKCWASGRGTSDYLDVMMINPHNNDIIMFEVKTKEELVNRYSDTSNKKNMAQLISYVMHQAKNTKIASYYAYDFEEKRPMYNNIYCQDVLAAATDAEDFYVRWNKVFNHDNFIVNNSLWGIEKAIKKYNDLQNITHSDTKNLYSQFLTILRLNSISDKPNAFMKVINLFLCKVADEIKQDTNFSIVDSANQTHFVSGLMFQFVDGIDTPVSFMKRLNLLYKEGMKKYLGKDVIEYTDQEIDSVLNGQCSVDIKTIIDNLRLKREHNFAFIEVYNDDTFLENFEVVKEIVRLLESYKFKYDSKQTFLGDFFEDLLNTSLKQEAGQFFTPYPLVDFMVKSLGIDNFITKKLANNEDDFIPAVIDYACGAGHFLISVMSEIQDVLNSKTEDDCNTNAQKAKLMSYKSWPYSFASRDKIIGIEKDYRLAKTTKISTFLNGDGDATIIAGDGINKFSAKEYQNTILSSNSNSINKFDFVISNPPYSVDGFMQSFRKNGIDKNSGTFSLLDKDLNDRRSDIETYFIERTYQLLKDGGYAAIVLPQSVLSQDKYTNVRKFILDNFIIKSMLLTADITFSGTTTSPVVLFLQKASADSLYYDVLISMSPKYMSPTGNKQKRKEEDFLGYSFSSNRAKSGITIIENSALKNLTKITKDFIANGCCPSICQNIRIVKLNDVLLNQNDVNSGDIYPKYEKQVGCPLSEFCKINSRQESEVSPKGYLEIGDLETQVPTKSKHTNRYCKKGDILISSLTPTKQKIVIAQDDFVLSSAIFVLSDFASDEARDAVYHKLVTPNVIKQMNTMLDGFKVTYAKISEQNLYKNVMI